MKEPTGTANYSGNLLIVTVPAKQGKQTKPLTTRYLVEDVKPDRSVAYPAYSLTKVEPNEAGEFVPVIAKDGTGVVYHVAVQAFGPTCDCEDFECRVNRGLKRRCKHIASMQAKGLLPK
jgi:hypothetical protein